MSPTVPPSIDAVHPNTDTVLQVALATGDQRLPSPRTPQAHQFISLVRVGDSHHQAI